jgi:hypothetical protein
MATRNYALERGGPKRLAIQWRWGWKRFEVSLDGGAPWRLEPASLIAGASLTLADGSSLFVRRLKRAWWSVTLRDELQLDRDGAPVPGSDGDPRVIGRRAASLIVLFGVLQLGLVGLWLVFQHGARDAARGSAAGASAELALIAIPLVALAVLGVLASLGLRLPVLIGAGLYAAELVVSLAAGARAPVAILIQALVVAHLVHAWHRMRPRPRQPSLSSVFE